MNFTPEFINQVIEGAYLLIDKPYGWTSFDVVRKVKYSLVKQTGVKKLKVGHAGTLDPLATGLLVVCTGKFTKRIEEVQAMPKTYTGTICLGATTPSYDLETEVDQIFSIEHVNESLVLQAIEGFMGEQDQIAPPHSAKYVNGQRAYELARKGVEVNLKPVRIHIYKYAITSFELPKLQFEVECSKGTYIRSLAHDLGLKLNTGGYLAGLRRTAIGHFNVKDALDINSFNKQEE